MAFAQIVTSLNYSKYRKKMYASLCGSHAYSEGMGLRNIRGSFQINIGVFCARQLFFLFCKNPDTIFTSVIP